MSKEPSTIEIKTCRNAYILNCEIVFYTLEEVFEFIRKNLRIPPDLKDPDLKIEDLEKGKKV